MKNCLQLYLHGLLQTFCENQLTVRSHLKKVVFIKDKILKTAVFNKDNFGKVERNKDSIKHNL